MSQPNRRKAIQFLLRCAARKADDQTLARARETRRDAIDALIALGVNDDEITSAIAHAWAEVEPDPDPSDV